MGKNSKVLGIIFPNMHDQLMPELTKLRTTASVPFGGRYRLIDFALSAFVAANIDDVIMPVKRNYVSLMDHVGSGKEWDLSRKIGGIKIFPPYSENGSNYYHGKIEALNNMLNYIEFNNFETVIMSDCGIVANVDVKDLVENHEKSGRDITIVYKKEHLGCLGKRENVTFDIDDNHQISQVYLNEQSEQEVNNSMWIYVLSKELLVKIIKGATQRGYVNFEKDVFQRGFENLTLNAYEHTGFIRRICGLHSYFEANMALLDQDNVRELFSQYPIYTKVRDDAPVKYSLTSKVNNIIAADGCILDGKVENSVLFRGVKIAENAVVKNCVLMQDTVVEEGAYLENVICDKNVVITKDKKLMGDEKYPVFIDKRSRV